MLTVLSPCALVGKLPVGEIKRLYKQSLRPCGKAGLVHSAPGSYGAPYLSGSSGAKGNKTPIVFAVWLREVVFLGSPFWIGIGACVPQPQHRAWLP